MAPRKWSLAPSLITRCNRVTGNRALAVFSSCPVGLSQERKSETLERERGHCPTFLTPHQHTAATSAGLQGTATQEDSCTGLHSHLPGARVMPLLTWTGLT